MSGFGGTGKRSAVSVLALLVLACGGQAERRNGSARGGNETSANAASATGSVTGNGGAGATDRGTSSTTASDAGSGTTSTTLTDRGSAGASGASTTGNGQLPPSCWLETNFDSCPVAFWETDPDDPCSLRLPVAEEGRAVDLDLIQVSLCTDDSTEPLFNVPDEGECQEGAWYYSDPPDSIRLCEATCELSEDRGASILGLMGCTGPSGLK